MHEIDMLLQLLPPLLTKTQLQRQDLPASKKNRETLKKESVYEDEELAKARDRPRRMNLRRICKGT